MKSVSSSIVRPVTSRRTRKNHLTVGVDSPPYDDQRLAIIDRKGYTVPPKSADCQWHLKYFLTNAQIPQIMKQSCATHLFYQFQQDQTLDLMDDVLREDPEYIPVVELDNTRDVLPRSLTCDLKAKTNDPHAMAQLRQGFKDSTINIRGLKLQFGTNPVCAEHLRDIAAGIGRKQHLSLISLETHPANTAAESKVFKAIGTSPSIEKLSVQGKLTKEHRPGVITALSNGSLKNVGIEADEESCLHMLDWAADAHGTGDMASLHPAPGASVISQRNLRLEFKPPKHLALTRWNTAVVRLAESGTTKSLHMPQEVIKRLTPETWAAIKGKMDVFPI